MSQAMMRASTRDVNQSDSKHQNRKRGKHGLIYYHVLEATVAQHQDSLLAVHNCYFLLVVALVH
jgi:hypothetical protein